jgi:hypothetical protein
MPLRNRVTPWSAIEASPGRGLFTGNRGCLVREAGRLATEGWRTKAWICCTLDWRGRKRPQMQPGVWTALYFLDEATAFAAGHRPCAYCRRTDYNRFMAAWALAFPQAAPWRAKAVDEVLHAERTARAPAATRLADLPDGALVERQGRAGVAWLKTGRALRRWSQEGYGPHEAADPAGQVLPVTVPAMLAVLNAGYRPALHPTAS